MRERPHSRNCVTTVTYAPGVTDHDWLTADEKLLGGLGLLASCQTDACLGFFSFATAAHFVIATVNHHHLMRLLIMPEAATLTHALSGAF
jgi:hypothetical protein